MACAVLTLECQALPCLPHLRSVNAHVISSLEASAGSASRVSFPRQAAALGVAEPEGRLTSGISSFAFQVLPAAAILPAVAAAALLDEQLAASMWWLLQALWRLLRASEDALHGTCRRSH